MKIKFITLPLMIPRLETPKKQRNFSPASRHGLLKLINIQDGTHHFSAKPVRV